MSEELHELHEHAEHAREHPDLAPVTLTMAVLAVLVATVSLLGHRTHTEEIILQNKVTDQWSYYQAKDIRLHTAEAFSDLAGIVAAKDATAAAKLQQKIGPRRSTIGKIRKRCRPRHTNWSRSSRSRTEKLTASIWAKSFWRSRS